MNEKKNIYKKLFIKGFLYLSILIFLLPLNSCKKNNFEISKQANDNFHVQNKDYAIPVLVRGNTASKKIILYIQGGPGYASLDFASIDYPGWKNTLEKDYAIAYYDQRGTGNKQGNFDQGKNTLSTWIGDLHQVAKFLKKAYGSEIIMLGHSFGGGLMYRYMIEYENLAVPTTFISANSPVTTDSPDDTLRWKFRHNFLHNTALLDISRGKRVEKWNEVLQWLKQNPVIKKLEGNDPYALMNQWNKYVEELVYIDYPEKPALFKDYVKVVFNSPYNPLPYFNNRYTEKLASQILKEEENDDLMKKLSLINNRKILILTGRYDDICPPEELEYVFGKISSMDKTMRVIDNAGHAPFTDNAEDFNHEIKSFIER